MFAFYLVQRGILGTSDREIWSAVYFEPQWQAFFDAFNSFPLIGLGALVAWRLRASGCLLFFASMALHCLADLPVHREDAHAHFFPFSSWRFESPVSYWDPAHHGLLFAAAEMLLVVAGTIALSRYSARPWRFVGAACLLFEALPALFALFLWGGL